jgi:hypothetical protein
MLSCQSLASLSARAYSLGRLAFAQISNEFSQFELDGSSDTTRHDDHE